MVVLQLVGGGFAAGGGGNWRLSVNVAQSTVHRWLEVLLGMIWVDDRFN